MTTTVPNHRSAVVRAAPVTHHRAATIDGVNIFYREAGPADAPVVLLLHGFPTSSHGHGNGEGATREEIAEALGTSRRRECGRRAGLLGAHARRL